jgi:hypothetical protein
MKNKKENKSVKQVVELVKKVNDKQTTKEVVWNSEIKVIKNGIIYIPVEFYKILQEIANKIDQEFFFLLKGEILGAEVFVTDWYCPEQEVSHSAVDVIEKDIPGGFNGVIHRHPQGCTSFSTTDRAYIDAFNFGILYIPPDQFPAGYLNFKINDDILLQVPAITEVLFPAVNIEPYLEKIKKKTYAYVGYQGSVGASYYGRSPHANTQNSIKGVGDIGAYLDPEWEKIHRIAFEDEFVID